MTNTEMLNRLKLLSGEEDLNTLAAYLDMAGDAIIRKAYPYRDDVLTVPVKYQQTQLKVAVFLLDKRGATGETAHNENGISRTYGGADIPDEMLRDVVPYVGVLSGGGQ